MEIKTVIENLQKEVLQLKNKENEHEEEKTILNEEIAKLAIGNSTLKTRLDDKDEDKEKKDDIEKIKKDQEGWNRV